MVRNNIPRALLAHLTSSDQEEAHAMEVQGQGQEHQLLTMGKYTESLYLTFQMSPGMKMSSPPVELSYSLAEEVTKTEVPSKIDVDDLCQRWMACQPFCWPYDDSRVER
ncbi:uncharacterized protein LOC111084404 [Limulus polyphemus]|uniref:Uncharacterized protein LOC111084404 n=1 Tax=Limulus polyphemus TaxID=6850 RepID=A0ABM1RZM8_LIMPO|nr:uncharacterized protein LOC111084404 [Limulus polyphemus]